MRCTRSQPRWRRGAVWGVCVCTLASHFLKIGGGPVVSRRAPLVSISRPVSRVLSARAKRPRVTAIPLRRRLPGALSNLPGRPDPDIDPEALPRRREPRAVPIRSCSRWGLPCRLRCRRRGALLPHRFTLTARSLPSAERDGAAVCSLWHFPWAQHPPDVIRHRMPMEPGLSSRTAFRPWPERPSSRLTDKGWGLLGPTSRPPASCGGTGWDQAPPRLPAWGCASRAAMRLLSVAIVEPSTNPSTRCGRK
jgi:hypothetical protein